MIFQRLSILLIFLIFTFYSNAAQAQITYVNTTDGTVNETVTPCTNSLIRQFSVPINYSVADVNIGVLMSHTYRSDLRMFLQSPQGTQITLVQNTGGNLGNFNILYDDSAAVSVTTHTVANDTATATTVTPPYQRTFRPLQALSAFNGQNANGTWTLSICDSVNVDSGTFFDSKLIITAQPATLSGVKSSSVINDNINTLNPKAIPGAVVRYCITISNSGPGIASNISINDSIPARLTYIPNTILSGNSCTTTVDLEDDNSTGIDESDPIGASFSAGNVNVRRQFMNPRTSFSVTFNALIN